MAERLPLPEGQLNSVPPAQDAPEIGPADRPRILPSIGGRPMSPNVGPAPEHAVRAINLHLS